MLSEPSEGTFVQDIGPDRRRQCAHDCSSRRTAGERGAEVTEEASLLVDGGHIYVCQEGPRHAPAFLLIHGSGASARTPDPLAPLLTGSHRVIWIDLLGHGRSDKPLKGDYAIPAQGRRVAAACRPPRHRACHRGRPLLRRLRRQRSRRATTRCGDGARSNQHRTPYGGADCNTRRAPSILGFEDMNL